MDFARRLCKERKLFFHKIRLILSKQKKLCGFMKSADIKKEENAFLPEEICRFTVMN